MFKLIFSFIFAMFLAALIVALAEVILDYTLMWFLSGLSFIADKKLRTIVRSFLFMILVS